MLNILLAKMHLVQKSIFATRTFCGAKMHFCQQNVQQNALAKKAYLGGGRGGRKCKQKLKLKFITQNNW